MTDQQMNLQKSNINPTPETEPNTLAIISLVASIASFLFLPVLGAITGIITGHLALRQIQATAGRGRPLAIWGLILGYAHIAFALLAVVVIVLLAVLGVSLFGAAASQGY